MIELKNVSIVIKLNGWRGIIGIFESGICRFCIVEKLAVGIVGEVKRKNLCSPFGIGKIAKRCNKITIDFGNMLRELQSAVGGKTV